MDAEGESSQKHRDREMGNVLNVPRSHQIGGELKSLGECVFGVGGVSKFGERTVKFPQISAWVLQEWLRIDEI